MNQLITEVGNALKGGAFYFRPSSRLVFVCGASADDKESSRTRFINHPTIKDPNAVFRFLFAERALDSINESEDFRFRNLADFEKQLASLADCILIFLESPGAIAEVGYFSHSDEILPKILIVADPIHQNDSFLNLGPIHLIETKSAFTPKLLLTLPLQNSDVQRVFERLDRLSKFTKYSKKVNHSHKDMVPIMRLEVTLKIVEIFGAIALRQVGAVFSEASGSYSAELLNSDAGILCHLKLIERFEENGEVFLRRISNNAGIEIRPQSLEDRFRLRATEIATIETEVATHAN